MPLYLAVSQFKEWVNIKFFFKLRKSAAEILVSFIVVYDDEALKNLLYTTSTTSVKMSRIIMSALAG